MPTRQQLSALRDYQCFVRHRRQRGCRVMASAVNGPPTRDTSIDILPPRMQRYLRIALPRLHAVRSERAHHGARPLCANSSRSLIERYEDIIALQIPLLWNIDSGQDGSLWCLNPTILRKARREPVASSWPTVAATSSTVDRENSSNFRARVIRRR
jgi:hypothetical protein